MQRAIGIAVFVAQTSPACSFDTTPARECIAYACPAAEKPTARGDQACLISLYITGIPISANIAVRALRAGKITPRENACVPQVAPQMSNWLSYDIRMRVRWSAHIWLNT